MDIHSMDLNPIVDLRGCAAILDRLATDNELTNKDVLRISAIIAAAADQLDAMLHHARPEIVMLPLVTLEQLAAQARTAAPRFAVIEGGRS